MEWVSGANRFEAPGEALFVAVADDHIVGISGLNRDPYACDPRTGRVRRLYVAPAYRRQGVGQALLESVITLLRVRTEAADRFYTAHGFRRVDSEADVTHVLELASVP